ncbi:trehalose-phosphatase [Halocatena halophila]|uniref:trehalose-phosphatase n=1 Tax=Halocatena halophila TaxID=2814576 RepID=UPI002ED5E6A0
MTNSTNDSVADTAQTNRSPAPTPTPAPLLCKRKDRFRHCLETSDAERLFLGLDFDGTLAPHVDDPTSAAMRSGNHKLLERLAAHPKFTVAVISGRELADLRSRVDVDGIRYAGNHGLEMDTNPPLESPDSVRSTIGRVCGMLERELASIDGVQIENKGITASVHYRDVETDGHEPEQLYQLIDAVVSDATTDDGKLRLTTGHDVIELRPPIDWDKGRALRQFIDEETASVIPLFIGDDTTDEDAFSVTRTAGIGIHVGTAETLADFQVSGPAAVSELLEWLCETGSECL